MNTSIENNDRFQRLSAGGAMSRAVSLLFQRMDVFLPIGAVCYVPTVALAVSMIHLIGSSMGTLSQATNGQQNYNSATDYNSASYSSSSSSSSSRSNDFMKQQGSQMGPFLFQFIVELFVLQLVVILARGAIVHAVASWYAQKPFNLLDSLKNGCSRWCDLFLTGLLVGAGVAICHVVVSILILAIVAVSDSLTWLVLVVQLAYFCFLIYLMVSFMVLTPVIMVERKTSSACIWRCLELANGNRCFILCTAFCIAVINWIVQLILAQILFAIHKDGHEVVLTAPTLYCIVVTMTSVLFLPMMQIMESVVYFNIRVEKEGMNLESLEGEMGFSTIENAQAYGTTSPEKKAELV